ncbi:hypothetical protein Tco_0670677 [Tanacetum coccineum]
MVQMTISRTSMNAIKLLMSVQAFRCPHTGQCLLIITVQNSEFTTTAMNCQVQSWFQVVPPAERQITSLQELELLFHHHITMLRILAMELGNPVKGDSLFLPDHRIHKDGDGDAHSAEVGIHSTCHANLQRHFISIKIQES